MMMHSTVVNVFLLLDIDRGWQSVPGVNDNVKIKIRPEFVTALEYREILIFFVEDTQRYRIFSEFSLISMLSDLRALLRDQHTYILVELTESSFISTDCKNRYI